MEVRFFGEFEALAGGVPVPVRRTKQRTVLALLALQRGGPVSADRLIDVLWGDEQIANAANALQAQVGQLRRTLGATAIVSRVHGIFERSTRGLNTCPLLPAESAHGS